jgi:peptide/nickel transport system permease protein
MLIGISLVMFVIMHMAPGDPASIRYGLNPEVSQSARAEFSRMYGLDRPLHIQYIRWLGRFFSLDFGRSLIDDKPVSEKIISRLPATLLLQGTALLVILLIAIPLGVAGALRHGSFFDSSATVLVFTGYSMPSFWLALMLIYFFGYKLGWFPVSGMDPWYTAYMDWGGRVKDLLWHLILPVAATVFTGIAALCRYTRSSVLEVLGEQFVVTAKAKGLPRRRIVVHHIIRNALLPVITILGLTLPYLISGSFIIESIFAWPGMGRLGYEAIMNYDYPVIMGTGVIAVFLTLAGILISDLFYAMADPRIRLGGGER